MKGVGILLVICLHTNTIPFDCLTKRLVYGFHLPLFFFVSGYLFREKPITDNLRKDIIRLIIPYFFTLFLCAIINGLIVIPTKGLYDYLFLTTKMFGGVDVGAIWFLPALFLTKNIFNIISHLPHKNQIIAFANVLIIIAYTIFSVKQIILGTFPFCIFPGIASVPFFAVGMIYRKRKIAHSAILLLALFYFVWCLFTQHTMVIAGGKYNFYILDFIAGIGGTLLMLQICKLIVQYKHLNSVISYIGRISLLILCVHSLQLTLGLRALTSETFSQIFLMLVASVPISMLLYKSKVVQKLF